MLLHNPSKGAFVTQRKSDQAILVVKPLGESHFGSCMLPEKLPDIYLQKLVTAQTATELFDAIGKLDPLACCALTEDEPHGLRSQPAVRFFEDFETDYEAVDHKRFANLSTSYPFRGPREYTNAIRVLEAADLAANPALREWLASVYSKNGCSIAVEPLADWALARALAAETLAIKNRNATGDTTLIYQKEIDLVKDHSPLYELLSTYAIGNFMDGSILGITYSERGKYRIGQTEYDHTVVPTSLYECGPLPQWRISRFLNDELMVISALKGVYEFRLGLEPHFGSAFDELRNHIECTHNSQLSQIIYSAALYGRSLRGVCSGCGVPLFQREDWDISAHYKNLCHRCHEREKESKTPADKAILSDSKELNSNEDAGNR